MTRDGNGYYARARADPDALTHISPIIIHVALRVKLEYLSVGTQGATGHAGTGAYPYPSLPMIRRALFGKDVVRISCFDFKASAVHVVGTIFSDHAQFFMTDPNEPKAGPGMYRG
ncbi:hypothetical protein AG1IA_03191 [Rhizoctonia solani AG-1 IA]|uniref:Uncharacterized protein n=1 Tax=Thanatephorus cucumeris (strain AG1-IA) TaxID=983506 RepID=L8X2F7_THACA|nr:hypothetical protein AG1IA_03191 [Rhizoctonia solani AG-1 IA]